MAPESIAHYRISSMLGEGAMGEVYRATDSRLGREVAIKLLPDDFARDPMRMARFTREAQVLASLNHPNIATIYGVEDRALIMELVEGRTLSERIKQGPVPLDEAVEIARQIADGLEAAHNRGVVHRDLKPANIKLTPEGTVKLLDFGLAKADGPWTTGASMDDAPTLTVAATGAGMILGTAAYMAPEQARGRNVDKRADIWAFGVILHEMLTGEQMFEGETVTDVLASVVRQDPDLIFSMNGDLYALPAEPDASGKRTPVAVIQSPANERGAYVSPDNRWIAYMSSETGRDEIYVQPFSVGGSKTSGKWMVSRGTRGMARWRADSRELMFVGPEGALVAVDVAPGAAFRTSAPKKLFQIPLDLLTNQNVGTQGDATRDAQRILMVMPVTESSQRELAVVLNWQPTLRK